MQGEWIDFNAAADLAGDPWFDSKPKKLRGFVRSELVDQYKKHKFGHGAASYSSIRNMYITDFVYEPETNKIFKNRQGTIEDLYEQSAAYIALKYHSDERVRRALEKAETLATLIGVEHV